MEIKLWKSGFILHKVGFSFMVAAIMKSRELWFFYIRHLPLKEFATDDSNASFEQCRVVLVVCHLSDHKCRHGNVYVKRQYKSL